MRDEGTGVDFIIFGLLVVFILALLKCNAQRAWKTVRTVNASLELQPG